MDNKRLLADLDNVDLVEDSSFTYRSGQSKSWKSIVLNHYDNCMKEGGKEMNIGGVQRRMVNGEVVEIMVPNQVEIFINHVEMLKRSLFAEIGLNKPTVEKMNAFEKTRADYVKQYREKRQELLKTYNSFSLNTNPDGITQRDMYRDRYLRLREQVDKIYNEKMLELYQEQLFPFLTELIASRRYFEET